jgi:ubiquinone/menaquinone biosynthesis C-methylase UbiE
MARSRRSKVAAILADLSLGAKEIKIPLRDQSQDSALASLLLSYVDEPEALLNEVYRVLRPGARIVVSSVLKDADLSRIYVESLEDPEHRASAMLGVQSDWRAQQDFLNDASRIIDFEEFGVFRFYDVEELCDMVRSAGFKDLRYELSFGDPPQAIVVSGTR